jgi:hypothetical protein
MEVTLGDSVTIDVLVTNTGDLPGNYKAVLQINDIAVQTREVTLDGGAEETVSFSVTPDTAGQYRVNVGDWMGTYEVKAPVSPGVKEVSPPRLEISSFSIAPSFDAATGKLISARIVYQMSQPSVSFPDARLMLKVSLDGEVLETIPLLTLSQLQSDGRTGSLGYIPSSGWATGQYTFQAELNEGENLVQSTHPEKLLVTPEAITKAVSWKTLGIIIGATMLVIIAVITLVLYRRRDMTRGYTD